MTKLHLVQAEHWSTPGRYLKIVAGLPAAQAVALEYVNILRADYDPDEGEKLGPVAGDWEAGLHELARRMLVDRGDQETVDGISDFDLSVALNNREDDLPCVWIEEVDADVPGYNGPAQGERHALICPRCGSDDIASDAAAKWSVETQTWELASTHDSETCQACGNEGDGMSHSVPVDQVPPRPQPGEERVIEGRGPCVWIDSLDYWETITTIMGVSPADGATKVIQGVEFTWAAKLQRWVTIPGGDS